MARGTAPPRARLLRAACIHVLLSMVAATWPSPTLRAAPRDDGAPRVRLDAGVVRGTEAGGIRAFLGIP